MLSRTFSTGEDWQERALNLLRQRHDDLQTMPSKHLGDYGIEAFSRTARKAFQCYAPDPLQSTADRYAHQRGKINEELSKLEKNDSKLAEMVGDHGIEQWIFLVPIHD